MSHLNSQQRNDFAIALAAPMRVLKFHIACFRGMTKVLATGEIGSHAAALPYSRRTRAGVMRTSRAGKARSTISRSPPVALSRLIVR